jgi:hypothetical protein
MLLLQFQLKVFGRHVSRIAGNSTRDPSPERSDCCNVLRPIADMLIKNWPDDAMLAHVGIEVMQEQAQSLRSTETNKERLVIHHL